MENLTVEIREKLKEAKDLYSKLSKVEEDIKVIVDREAKRYGNEIECHKQLVSEYMEYAKEMDLTLVEAIIMRDMLSYKIEAMLED